MTEPEQAWVAYSGVTAASLVSMVQNLFHSISDAAATNARLSKGTSSGREPEALRRCLVSAAPSVSAHDQRPEPELAAAESAAAHSRSPWLVTVDVEEVRELTVTLLSGALSQSLAQSVARAGAQSSVTSAVTAAAVTADAAVAVPAAVQALSTMLMVTASAATVTTTNEAPLTQSGAVPAAVERFLSVIKSSCDRALATAAVSDTNAVAANAVAEALAAANGLATGAGAKTVSTSSAIGNRWGEECAWTALAAIHNNSNNKNSRKNLSSTDFNIASGASLTTGAAAAAAALATALTSQSSAARESGLDCAWVGELVRSVSAALPSPVLASLLLAVTRSVVDATPVSVTAGGDGDADDRNYCPRIMDCATAANHTIVSYLSLFRTVSATASPSDCEQIIDEVSADWTAPIPTPVRPVDSLSLSGGENVMTETSVVARLIELSISLTFAIKSVAQTMTTPPAAIAAGNKTSESTEIQCAANALNSDARMGIHAAQTALASVLRLLACLAAHSSQVLTALAATPVVWSLLTHTPAATTALLSPESPLTVTDLLAWLSLADSAAIAAGSKSQLLLSESALTMAIAAGLATGQAEAQAAVDAELDALLGDLSDDEKCTGQTKTQGSSESSLGKVAPPSYVTASVAALRNVAAAGVARAISDAVTTTTAAATSDSAGTAAAIPTAQTVWAAVSAAVAALVAVIKVPHAERTALLAAMLADSHGFATAASDASVTAGSVLHSAMRTLSNAIAKTANASATATASKTVTQNDISVATSKVAGGDGGGDQHPNGGMLLTYHVLCKVVRARCD